MACSRADSRFSVNCVVVIVNVIEKYHVWSVCLNCSDHDIIMEFGYSARLSSNCSEFRQITIRSALASDRIPCRFQREGTRIALHANWK